MSLSLFNAVPEGSIETVSDLHKKHLKTHFKGTYTWTKDLQYQRFGTNVLQLKKRV